MSLRQHLDQQLPLNLSSLFIFYSPISCSLSVSSLELFSEYYLFSLTDYSVQDLKAQASIAIN